MNKATEPSTSRQSWMLNKTIRYVCGRCLNMRGPVQVKSKAPFTLPFSWRFSPQLYHVSTFSHISNYSLIFLVISSYSPVLSLVFLIFITHFISIRFFSIQSSHSITLLSPSSLFCIFLFFCPLSFHGSSKCEEFFMFVYSPFLLFAQNSSLFRLPFYLLFLSYLLTLSFSS